MPVKIIPLEPQQLAFSHPRIEEHPNCQLLVRVPLGGGGQHPSHPIWLKHRYVLAWIVAKAESLPKASGWITGADPIFLCLVEKGSQRGSYVLDSVLCQGSYTGLAGAQRTLVYGAGPPVQLLRDDSPNPSGCECSQGCRAKRWSEVQINHPPVVFARAGLAM